MRWRVFTPMFQGFRGPLNKKRAAVSNSGSPFQKRQSLSHEPGGPAMAPPRRRFVQLWERLNSAKLPIAFCFSREEETNQLRCFSGEVRTVRRSRTFLGRSSVYGLVKTTELAPAAEAQARDNPPPRNGRLIRSRILDRMARAPWVSEPAVSDAGRPAPAGGIAAAAGSGSEPVQLI